MTANELPKRKRLPHDVPSWIPDETRHFITINCLLRNANVLCCNGVAEGILKNIDIYEEQGRWYPWLAVVMPDHIHMIASFHHDIGIKRTVAAWKGYQAKQFAIEWQSGFFEHRLRSIDEFEEKASYVRNNPVRKGLVKEANEWSYVWERVKDGSPGGFALPGVKLHER